MDTMDNMPDPGEDADSPIIVPRPGQILRRAARTKIRNRDYQVMVVAIVRAIH